MKQSGFLVIADLSNYTAFLTQSELGDADDILRSVISTVLAHTRPPLVVSRLEGDAIFSYAPRGSPPNCLSPAGGTRRPASRTSYRACAA